MYEQLDLSQYIFGMPMDEADFLLNDEQEVQYNEICQDCRKSCKQSFRCEIVECPKFAMRRRKNKNKKKQLSENDRNKRVEKNR